MGDLFIASPPHTCDFPINPNIPGGILFRYPAARPAGSIWECNICSRRWVAAQGLIGPTCWIVADSKALERWSIWRPATTTEDGQPETPGELTPQLRRAMFTLNGVNPYQLKALKLVDQYIDSKLDKSDPPVTFGIFVVWFSKTLQNWKALVSTTLPDQMYYEVTYNGDKHETYIDAYKKFENVVVTDEAYNNS